MLGVGGGEPAALYCNEEVRYTKYDRYLVSPSLASCVHSKLTP
jgi:hypothetical protein